MANAKFKIGDRVRVKDQDGEYSGYRRQVGAIKGKPFLMSPAVFLAPGESMPDTQWHYNVRIDRDMHPNPQVFPESWLEFAS